MAKKMNEIPVTEQEISELQKKISEQIQINES
jgi:hypothetical protein